MPRERTGLRRASAAFRRSGVRRTSESASRRRAGAALWRAAKAGGQAQSKRRRGVFANLGLIVALFSHFAALRAQPSATNQVLELDGNGSYVELPLNILNDLEEATVEAWVRWYDFSGTFKRVFNYGGARRDLGITTRTDTANLWFVLGDAQPGFARGGNSESAQRSAMVSHRRRLRQRRDETLPERRARWDE